MAKDLNCSVKELITTKSLRSKIEINRYISDTIGLPTLEDIVNELGKPGRDPREAFQSFTYASGIHSLSDLYTGLRLPGIVTNLTAFGAFVDIGVHQDGLIHISELADTFVKDPAEIVKVNQKVNVTVLSVDSERKRIALSLKTTPVRKEAEKSDDHKAAPSFKKKGKQRETVSKTPFNNPFAKLLNK
jgi:uncharacterized protein